MSTPPGVHVTTTPPLLPRLGSRGQSLVEFALVLPVLLLLLVIALDFGRAYLGWVSLNNAAREAADFASNNTRGWTGAGDAAIQARYAAAVAVEMEGATCDLDPVAAPTFPSGTDLGGTAVADLTCQFRPITPLMTLVTGSVVPIGARSSMPIRTGALASLPGGGGGSTTNAPIAAIAGGGPSPSSGTSPLTVTFIDASANGATSWLWQFGDGAASNEQGTVLLPVEHVYTCTDPTPCTFNGSLTVSNSAGTDVEFFAVTVDPAGTGPVVAGFSATPLSGPPSLAVTFTDASTGDIGTWEWDMDGDGITDRTGQTGVTFTYTQPGTYTVSLRVTSTDGTATDDEVKSGYIVVDDQICVIPNFAGLRVSGAQALWSGAGFTGALTITRPPNNDYEVSFQSIQGGLSRPCDGTSITVAKTP